MYEGKIRKIQIISCKRSDICGVNMKEMFGSPSVRLIFSDLVYVKLY